jgi:hypothetical protein
MLSEVDKLQLKELLMKIEDHELQHIFDLLQRNNVKHTRNNRGVFFTDEDITPELLNDIYKYVRIRFNEQLMYRKI